MIFFNDIGAIGVTSNHKRTELCSVQLFHVDHNRSPYWINGGLLFNKIYDSKKLANMKEWLIEPGVWSAGINHAFCITTDNDHEAIRFVEREIDAIEKSLVIYTNFIEGDLPSSS